MTGALAMHDHLLRELLHHHCGYEVNQSPCVCSAHFCVHCCACLLADVSSLRGVKWVSACAFANLLESLYGPMLQVANSKSHSIALSPCLLQTHAVWGLCNSNTLFACLPAHVYITSLMRL